MEMPAVNSHAPITDIDARLAVELAIQISPIPEVLRRYGLNTSDLKRRLKDPMFYTTLKEAKRNWNSDLSVKERIKLKSQMLTEDSLLFIYSTIHSPDNALPAKLDAFKQLATIAEVNAPSKVAGAEGSKFTVHINLGGDKPLVIDAITQED